MAESESVVIVVAGATGTGKSRLAIELGCALSGEIVNADSMQIYKGLDIATAKVTKQEQSLIPHHLLDVLEPHESITVVEYQKMALEKIRDIHSRGKIPILVGGTNYYIQSVIWTNELIQQNEDSSDDDSDAAEEDTSERVHETPQASFPSKHKTNVDVINLLGLCSSELRKSECTCVNASLALSLIPPLLLDLDGNESPAKTFSPRLYQILQIIDPEMSVLYHPSDFRRIYRSLQVFSTTGRKQSDLARENKANNHLRFRTLLFWVDTAREVLYKRLDERVAQMKHNGLVGEVLDLYSALISKGIETPFYHGTLQSIGYKEFRPFIEASVAGVGQVALEPLLDESVERTKHATRRYACRQMTWIRNKLIRNGLFCLRLDTSNPDLWDVQVFGKALSIAQGFLKDSSFPALCTDENVVCPIAKKEWAKFFCEKCQKSVNGPHEWQIHLKSKSHRKRKNSHKHHHPQTKQQD